LLLIASPKIIDYKTKVIAVTTLFAMLPCNYTGTPNPSVSWMLNDRTTVLEVGYQQVHKREPPLTNKYIIPHENGSLTFNYVEDTNFHTDNGIYTCIVNNMFGVVTANTTLIVSRGKLSLSSHYLYLYDIFNRLY
jgi:hypothetical protein